MISWRRSSPRRAPSPFFLTAMALIAGFGALVAWLALTAEDPAGRGEEATPTVADKAAAKPSAPRRPLAAVPDPDLIEDGKYGPLPKVDGDRAAWQVYARPFEKSGLGPRIAIVMTGLGLKRGVTEAAITRLPGAVSLAFSPYAPELQKWITAARQGGHEVLVQLPMEPANYPRDDPGPHVLLTGAQAAANLDRLDWLLSRMTGYVGAAADMGGRFGADQDAMRPVLAVLRQRGLMYLDTLPAAQAQTSVAVRIGGELELPLAVANQVIDGLANRTAIDARLGELEVISRRDGFAVGIAHPYPVTVARLERWLATLDDIGLELAPVTAVAAPRPQN